MLRCLRDLIFLSPLIQNLGFIDTVYIFDWKNFKYK
jgi:hypothetical protein